MRICLLMMLLATAVVAPAHAEPSKPVIQRTVTADVLPGKSLGGIKLGATRDQLGATFAETTRAIGPYTVVFDRDGHVETVMLALVAHGHGIRIAGKRIAAATPLEQLVKLVPGCGPIESLIGGRIAKCAGGVRVSAGGPVGIVSISVGR
jgi:hypothetical protein